MEDNKTITIPFEEYKELLIIKGKYEELKSQTSLAWDPSINFPKTKITYRDSEKELKPPYKVTC